jgi:membrane peptidoglycan carboxypeptidase
VSNPDSPRDYWPGSARGGRHGARAAGSREDSYGRDARYSEPADGYGRRAAGRGNGSYPDGGGRSAGGRARDGYGRDGYRERGNGQRGYDRNGGNGNGASYSPSGGNGRAGYGRSGSNGNNGYGRSNGNGAGYSRGGDPDGRGRGGRYGGNGYERDGRNGSTQYGARTRGSQIGNELRSKLGLGRGATRGGYDQDGYGYPDGDATGYRNGGGRTGTATLRQRATERLSDGTRGMRLGGGGGRGGWDRGRRGGGGGPRWRRWLLHWTWKKAGPVTAAMALGIFAIVVAGVMYAYSKTQVPTAVSEAALQQSSTVYFSDGKTAVGTFSAHGIDRQLLQSNQIPAVMKNAMVAAEDRRFYTEGGISPTGIMRAAYTDLKGGDYAQGGSTLTQQFVRNYYSTIGTKQTLSRKFKEIFVAIKLSHEKSKDWILTEYLNMVPFGDNAYGVSAASQTYFGEPAMNLTISQAAMLAAMPNQPSFFNPNPKAGAGYTALVSRWKYVLGNMVRDGVITQQQADQAKFPTVVSNGSVIASGWSGYKGYIMQAVEQEMAHLYGIPQDRVLSYLDGQGLKIVTTFNPTLMNGLYATVAQEEQQMKNDGMALPSFANVGAVLEQPGTGAILAMYSGPNYAQNNYDMALQSRNQVGSSFKPYVLATAVHEGMDVQNSVLNAIEPMCIPPDTPASSAAALSTSPPNFSSSLPNSGCPTGDFPVNIQGENGGPMTVANAAAQSSDPAFEDLIHRVGTQNTIDMAKQFGVDTVASGLQAKQGEVGIALGIASLTVEEQATTFATLDNGGTYVTPHVIAQMTRPDGSVIPLRITKREVLSPAEAADVDYALSFDTINGTAFPNAVLNPVRPTIGKTGTTDHAQTALFAGAIPQFSMAVAIFTDKQTQSLDGLPSIGGVGGSFGGAWPATIWQAFMNSQFSNLPVMPLATPDYNGFTQWVQVPKANQPTPNPTPSHGHGNPNPNPSPTCTQGFFGRKGCPSPSPSPSPSPTNPFPTPTLSTLPPGGGGGPGG